MSMRHYPNSGYMVEADKLISLVSEDKRDLFLQYIKDRDYDGCNNLLTGPDIPLCSCFSFDEEDEVDDDLKYGVVYAYFYEDDLYIKTPSNTLVTLNKAGITPRRYHWAIWA